MPDLLNRLATRLTLPAAEALMVASAVILHNYRIPTAVTGIRSLLRLAAQRVLGIKESILGHLKDPDGFVDALGVELGKFFLVDVTATREEQLYGAATPPPPPFAPLSAQERWEKLTDPPARIAIVAGLVFFLSAQYIYEWNEQDRYQRRFLMAGLVVGLHASLVAWCVDGRYLFACKTFLPFSVAAALVFSAVAHRSFLAKAVVVEEKKEQ